MNSGELIEGNVYKHKYIGGRVYDPDMYDADGIFLGKITSEGADYYLLAEKMTSLKDPFYYIRYIPKGYITKDLGPNTDPMYTDLKKAIHAKEYKHPEVLANTRISPYVLIKKQEIDVLSGKQKAREKIGNFMTEAIYSGPIYNQENKEKVLFTGGPMYKRGLASFMKQQGKTRKQHGGEGMGQPLKYTDESYNQPMANAGRNLLGVVAPITIRPGIEASPMTGGTMAMSPMKFQDAYHGNPMSPTGQPLTFKLPATLNQGLNMGQLGGKRYKRKGSRKGRSKGGFYPSVMGGVVSNAPLLIPLAARQSMRLLEEYKILGRKTRRNRRSQRKATRRNNKSRRH